MKRSEDRILTTHVGSLIRPPEVLKYALAQQRGEPIDEAPYEAALRDSVAEVVRWQAGLGIDIPSDGEFGKSSWANYILDRVSGYEHRPQQAAPLNYRGRDVGRFPDFFGGEAFPGTQSFGPTQVRGPVNEADICIGPIAYTGKAALERDIGNFEAAAAAAGVDEGFLPVAAPASAAFNGVNEYYPSEKEYIYALADALKVEYTTIVDAGLIVQVDDAVLANAFDDLMSRSRETYRGWAELRIDALNHALQGIPEDRVRYHVCWGSWHAPHMADAPLEEIIDLVLRVNAGAYSVEAANARHEHEWQLWETIKLPPGKVLIPGVITHHTLTVEHPELVAQRIERYAGVVGRENVIAGTDCGFARARPLSA